MSIHYLACIRSLYCLLRRVPNRSDLTLLAIQACSGWCPPATSALHHLLNALSDLHRPLRRTKCASIPNGVCFQHLFPHNLTYLSTYLFIYLFLDGSLPLTPPLNSQSQITGNLAVYGFAFSHFSPTPSPPVPGCILSDFCGRARALLFGCFSGPPKL